MIAVCQAHDRKLMYAEELCFAPKYERVRSSSPKAPLGRIYHMRQCEKHSGPHSDWFYDVEQIRRRRADGHGLPRHRVVPLDARRPARVVSVSRARMQTGLIHARRTRGEENSVCIVEFEGGAIGVVENSWAKLGGMDDRVEVCGTGGVIYADLFMGKPALTFSEKGYGYAMEKAGTTQGWTFTILRRGVQSGIPAGAAALHRLRARRHASRSSPAKTAAPCSR